MPRTPHEMRQAISMNLAKHTGKILDEWIAIVNARAPAMTRERVEGLKSEYK